MDLITGNLPDKISDLLELALSDLELCENNPKYRIEMGSWHSPEYVYLGEDEGFSEDQIEYCAVCLAGALMANTLKAKYEKDINPHHFDEVTARKLKAIDCIRIGKFPVGFKYVTNKSMSETVNGISINEKLMIELIPLKNYVSYELNQTAFKEWMKEVINVFRKHGY